MHVENLLLDSQRPFSFSFVSLRHLTLELIYLGLQVRSLLLLDALVPAKSDETVRLNRNHTLASGCHHLVLSITIYSWNARGVGCG